MRTIAVFLQRLAPSRLHTALLLVLISPLVVCSGLVFGPTLYNSLYLYRFARQLYTYPLPPQTVYLAAWTRFSGSVTGDLCSFTVYQQIRTTLPIEQLQRYYITLPVRSLELETYPGLRSFPNHAVVEIPQTVAGGEWYTVTVALGDSFIGMDDDVRCRSPEYAS